MLVVLLIWVIFHDILTFTKVIDNFEGSDPGESRRWQMINGVSLGDRQAQAIANTPQGAKVSNMTASPEAPVFWQDYDYDMMSSKTGLRNSREGMENEKKFPLG